jgi:uncharacterized protein YbbC (DUF1343 family)
MASVYWYPSICLFEGTCITEGRGTENPFCIFGHPSFSNTMFTFTPNSSIGAKEPKFKNLVCYGWNVYNTDAAMVLSQINNKLQTILLILGEIYRRNFNFIDVIQYLKNINKFLEDVCFFCNKKKINYHIWGEQIFPSNLCVICSSCNSKYLMFLIILTNLNNIRFLIRDFNNNASNFS